MLTYSIQFRMISIFVESGDTCDVVGTVLPVPVINWIILYKSNSVTCV